MTNNVNAARVASLPALVARARQILASREADLAEALELPSWFASERSSCFAAVVAARRNLAYLEAEVARLS